jgi:nitroreductase
MEASERYQSLFDLCAVRTSRREFQDRPLDPELIEKIKALAHTSPYASGRTNWEVEVVTDRAAIAAMAAAIDKRVAQLHEHTRSDFRDEFATYARNFSAFKAAPAVFVPTFRIAPSLSLMNPAPEIRQWERDNYVKSIACVAMLILLAAESLGLAACYMTGGLIAEEALGPLVGIKRGRSIGALIPIGYRVEKEE